MALPLTEDTVSGISLNVLCIAAHCTNHACDHQCTNPGMCLNHGAYLGLLLSVVPKVLLNKLFRYSPQAVSSRKDALAKAVTESLLSLHGGDKECSARDKMSTHGIDLGCLSSRW